MKNLFERFVVYLVSYFVRNSGILYITFFKLCFFSFTINSNNSNNNNNKDAKDIWHVFTVAISHYLFCPLCLFKYKAILQWNGEETEYLLKCTPSCINGSSYLQWYLCSRSKQCTRQNPLYSECLEVEKRQIFLSLISLEPLREQWQHE